MRIILCLCTFVGALTWGCKEAPIEPATLEGGETITYALEGITQGPIGIEATETGYRISAPSTGLPAEEVAANLRNGRKQLPFFDLGLLWLEPSQRRIGGQVHLGNVVSEEVKAQRPAFKLQERNGRVDYWFCKETGFLVQRRVNPSGPTLTLVSSTIPGL
jgi:hypothetical protein